MLSLRVLACSEHKISASRPRHRSQVRLNDIKRAIHHAKNLCANYEDTPECRSAWERVEELSAELDRQLSEKVSPEI